ncbi:MAG: hypothetical protein Q9225_000652 [Loekoesia sp. 1 TL-2023]
MADSIQQLEEDDCLTPRQSTVIDLEYPSIPVDGTPDSWLSNSLLVPMASDQDNGSVRSTDDTVSSLGDSTYDFVDDNSFATTDNEDQSRMTDSVSVTGNSVLEGPEHHGLERLLSADNVPSLSSNSSEHESVREFVSSPASGQEAGSSEGFPQTSQQQHVDQQSPSTMHNIRFEEIHHSEGIYPLESSSAPRHLAVTVRQHMLDQKLSSGGSYKVFYVGSLAARERIITKIGAALSSTAKLEASGPSRYSIVPVPSSDDPTCWGEPVLLDWSGHEIVVYHCIDASFFRIDSGHDSIDLTLEDHTHIRSSWDGAGFSVSGNWEFPDVSIFYLSDHDNLSARQTRRFARSFMARHQIPSIIITEEQSWDRPSEVMSIDRLTPHVCLQTKGDTASSPSIVKRLPIDVSTFSRLDALQLNQNLAYLDKESSARQARALVPSKPRSERTTGNGRKGVSSSYRSTFKPWVLRKYLGTTSPISPYLLDFLATAAVCVIISVIVSQLSLFSTRYVKNAPSFHSAGSNASTVTSLPVATSTALLQGKPITTQSLTVPGQTKSITPQCITGEKSHTDLATLWLESSPKTANKSEKFEVHVLGNTHIILRPPHWFTKLRKTPKLMFNVTRGGRVVKHEVSTLFDGVYALGLPGDDMHGLVNISLWTDSKPKIYEKLQADFGNPWLHAGGWRKAANALSSSFRSELDLIQASLTAAYIRSSAQLNTLMRKTLANTEVFKRETQDIGKASIGRFANFRDLTSTFPAEVFSYLSQSLEKRQSAVAKEVALRAAHLRQSISSYLSNKVHLGQAYARAAPVAYQIQVRNTQKRALKLWWGIVGLPRERPVSVRARGKSRACDGKRRKPSVTR